MIKFDDNIFQMGLIKFSSTTRRWMTLRFSTFLELFSSRSHHPLGSSGPLRRRWVPCQGWPKTSMCSDPVNLDLKDFCSLGIWIKINQSFFWWLSNENHMRIFLNLRSFFEDSNFMFFGCDESSLRFECFKKHPVKMKQMKHLHQMVWKCTLQHLQHSLLQDAESQSVYWVCLASGQDGSWAVFFVTIPVQKQWFSKWYS